jgi:hypothetical protein
MTIASHTKCKKCEKRSHVSTFRRNEEIGYVCLDQAACRDRAKTKSS